MPPRRKQPKKRINARVTIQAYQFLCIKADEWGVSLNDALNRLLTESAAK